MSYSPDRELLGRYTRTGDTEAFAALVHRHIGFVYAAARRQTRDSHLAEDITQAVFLVLARRARTIRSNLAMTTWLFGVTRRVCQNALKLQSRRRFHESSAAALRREELCIPREDLSDLRALLDDAIGHLPKCDQGGLIMHFFGNFSYAEVGRAMGTSADAARKRIERALDKMKQFLARQGIEAGGAALSATITNELTVRPPAYLVESATNVAVLATTESFNSSTMLWLAEDVSRKLALAKLKLAMAGGIAALVTIGLPLLAHVSTLPFTSVAGVVATATAPTTAPTTAQSGAPLKIDIDPKITIEILGAAKFPEDDGWVSPTGAALDDLQNPFANVPPTTSLPLDSQALIRVRHPKDTLTSVTILGSAVDTTSDEDSPADEAIVTMLRVAFRLETPADRFGVRFSIADEPWATVITHESPTEAADSQSEKFGKFHVSPIREQEDHSIVDVEFTEIPAMVRLIAIDEHGVEHAYSNADFNYNGADAVANFTFPIPPAKVAKLRLEARAHSKTIEVTNLALSRGVTAEPVVKVTKLQK